MASTRETESIIDQMYNIPEQQHDQALKEKASRAAKMIWVTFQKEGMHKYPAALDDPKLAKRMGIAARITVEQRLNHENTIGKLSELYLDLLQQ